MDGAIRLKMFSLEQFQATHKIQRGSLQMQHAGFEKFSKRTMLVVCFPIILLIL